MTREDVALWKEHQERLYAMAVDDGETWDLSENDQAACNAGGDAIAALLAKSEHDGRCESEMTSHGYTPCRCAERGSCANRTCPKAAHSNQGGYLHGEDDDSPYNVDGVSYCGRCHMVID
jgi:hypothetical protein